MNLGQNKATQWSPPSLFCWIWKCPTWLYIFYCAK